MIISPVAFHRALFRQGRKPELVRYAHRMATGGLGFMLVAMVSSVLLITDYLLNTWAAVAITAVAGAWFLMFWVVLPFARRNWAEDDEDNGYDEAVDDGRPSATPSQRSSVESAATPGL
jgi:hypothetical protein